MDPIGAHQFWGFSPALDLQQIYRTVFGADGPGGPTVVERAEEEGEAQGEGQKAHETCASASSAAGYAENKEDSGPSEGADGPSSEGSKRSSPPVVDLGRDPINILLIQPGDPRHILKTIAQRYRHSSRPLHFYVYERSIEVLARHVLLIALALDFDFPIRQRALTWLEVYGNACVQGRTAKYISARLKNQLISLLCDGAGDRHLAELFDFSLLKFKQRDELEGVFKTYGEDVPADMVTLRDYRLRHHYGTRYDFRDNLIDWDYQSAIKPCAGCVHFTQYRDWRNSGIAFEFGDQKYDHPNRTMMSYIEGRERGSSKAVRGYWGDIVVSPFHAVGTAAYVPTDEEVEAYAATYSVAGNHAAQLFEITSRHAGSEQWRHHSVEIAIYNLLSWLGEIEKGKLYTMEKAHDVFSGLGAIVSSEAAIEPDPKMADARRHRALKGVSITLLAGSKEELINSRRLKGFIDVLCISSAAVSFMQEDQLMSLIGGHGGGIVITETARNIPSLKKAQHHQFTKKLVELGAAAGCFLVGSDRELSSDTYSVGTVIDLSASAQAKPPPSFGPDPSISAKFLERPSGYRAKGLPMVLYSHNPLPHPQTLQLFPSLSSSSMADAGERAAVRHLKIIEALSEHDVQKGDNPLPEALIFGVYIDAMKTLAEKFRSRLAPA